MIASVIEGGAEAGPLPTPPQRRSKDNRRSTGSSVDSRSSRSKHSSGSSTRRRVSASSHDISSSTIDLDQHEPHDLRYQLQKMIELHKLERKRAEDAEKQLLEVVQRLTDINHEKLVAQQDAAALRQELNLYKIQLDATQQEVYKAQDVVKVLEEQRRQAERSSAKARSMARKLKDERMIHIAKEEGRRMGFEEGLERGRYFVSGQPIPETYPLGSEYPSGWSPDDLSEEDEDEEEIRTIHGNNIQGDTRPSTRPSSPPVRPVPPTQTQTPRQRDSIHPIPVYNFPNSTPHAPVHIPPLNYIPEAGPDSFIPIPPPHELERPPPTPEQSYSPSLPQENSRPIPVAPRYMTASPRSVRSSNTRDDRRSQRAPSPASTISQFELLNHPDDSQNRGRMSAIPEVGSPFEANASPRPAIVINGNHASSNTTSPDVPTPSSMRDSSGDDGEIRISILPASLPTSNSNSPRDPMPSTAEMSPFRDRDRLSPADALRVAPLPATNVQPASSSAPIPLSSSDLPPFFVATGFTPNAGSSAPLPGSGLPGAYSFAPEDANQGPPVIPPRMIGDPDPESDDDSSDRRTQSSADTLTTPPMRNLRRVDSVYSTATGAGVPLPPSTVGSPKQGHARNNSAYSATSRVTGAGVPLPPSSVGSPRPGRSGSVYSAATSRITGAGVPLPPSTVGSPHPSQGGWGTARSSSRVSHRT